MKFSDRAYLLVLVLVLSTAFVEGLYLLGRELGPAASVREQYRIFQIEQAKTTSIIEHAMPGLRS